MSAIYFQDIANTKEMKDENIKRILMFQTSFKNISSTFFKSFPLNKCVVKSGIPDVWVVTHTEEKFNSICIDINIICLPQYKFNQIKTKIFLRKL